MKIDNHTIGYILYGFIVLFLVILAIVKGKDFWHAIEGDDGKLDLIDLVGLAWVVLFPIMVLSDIFLDAHASEPVWNTMDIIMGGVILKKGAETVVSTVVNKKPNKPEDKHE